MSELVQDRGQDRGRTRAPGRGRVLGLDLVRLFAALLVVAYHFGFWHWTRRADLLCAWFDRPSPLGERLHFGWVGVEIFFVISGFVIAYSAEGASPARFARSRALRLAPGVWACATLALLLYVSVLDRPPGREVFAYVATMLFAPVRYIDDVYWTLSIEISFYILVNGLIRWGRLARLERLMTAIGLLSGLFWAVALLLQSGLEGRVGWLAVLRQLTLRAEANRLLQFALVQHGCLFALGVVIHQTFSAGLTRARGLAIAALATASLAEIAGQDGIIARAAGLPLSPLPAQAVWLAVVGLMLLAIRFDGVVAARLPGPWRSAVGFLGRTTFPLYLIHNSVGLSATRLLAPAMGPSAVLVGVSAALAAACLIQLYPERWIGGSLRQVLDAGPPAILRRRPVAAPAFNAGADHGG